MPSTTRLPFTSTCVTRADMVVVKVVARLVVPSPSRDWLEFEFSRLARAPEAALGPAAEVMPPSRRRRATFWIDQC